MVGVADCFGISGNPWELMQHFGLTAEHIAERVLGLRDKKLAASHGESPEVPAIRWSRCGRRCPSASTRDEICSECDYQSLELCAACRIEWGAK
jgi:hypothetical protein